MCTNNALCDVKTVNSPNLPQIIGKNKDIFVYATYLPPGYHKVLIYDPLQDKAFCKDFVVALNQQDWYPEYPSLFGSTFKKITPNIWRKWVDDSPKEIGKAF
jgi:hypothetical protein